jgi:hypothetical protein
LPRQFEEQPDRVILALEMMDERLSGRADPAPPAREARLAKQGLGNLHGIIASHVLRWVRPLGVEMVGLLDHGTRVAQSTRQSNETFESISADRFILMMHRAFTSSGAPTVASSIRPMSRSRERRRRERGSTPIVPAEKIDFCSRFGLFTGDFDGD